MKRIRNAVIIYFVMCLLGTFVGAIFSMLCMNVTNLVIGTRLPLLSLPLFIKGIFLTFPLASVVSLLLIVLYHIRHNKASFLVLVAYILLGSLTWLFLTPQALKLSFGEDMRLGITNNVVSLGYYREDDGLVYYWASLSPDGRGEGFVIDLYGQHGKAGTIYPLHDAEVQTKRPQSIFADTIVSSAIKAPRIVASPLAVYLLLLYQGRDAASRGYSLWLSFATIGLALLSVYGLGWLSTWKLLNAFLVMIASVGIAFLNYGLYTNLQFLSNAWLSHTGSFGSHLPLSTCVNIFISLVFSLAGILKHVADTKARGVSK